MSQSPLIPEPGVHQSANKYLLKANEVLCHSGDGAVMETDMSYACLPGTWHNF